VFNYPLPPEHDDEATANEMGWLPPAPMDTLLTDYAGSLDLPPLLEQDTTDMDTSHSDNHAAAAAAGPANADGTASEAAAGAAAGGGAGLANGGFGSSSLPNGLAARMQLDSTPGQVRRDINTDKAAATAAAANGLAAATADGTPSAAAAATANGVPGGAERKRVRSMSSLNGIAVDAAAAAATGAGGQQQQEKLSPASKKAKPAAAAPAPAAAPNADQDTTSDKQPPQQQQPHKQRPKAAAMREMPSVQARRAVLANIPLPSRSLVLMALTCASCHEAFDFERLEFLGDVVLKALAAHVMLGVSVF
jgi:hypothetical protein